METISLREADKVEINTVLDNTSDLLLPSTETVKRPWLGSTLGKKALMAEHGFSATVKVTGAHCGTTGSK